MNTTNTVPSKGDKVMVEVYNPRAGMNGPRTVTEVATVISSRKTSRGVGLLIETSCGRCRTYEWTTV